MYNQLAHMAFIPKESSFELYFVDRGLDDNQISRIPSGVFEGLPNLRDL